jgi:non-reducing end alpha-L-arabinofuranosidase
MKSVRSVAFLALSFAAAAACSSSSTLSNSGGAPEDGSTGSSGMATTGSSSGSGVGTGSTSGVSTGGSSGSSGSSGSIAGSGGSSGAGSSGSSGSASGSSGSSGGSSGTGSSGGSSGSEGGSSSGSIGSPPGDIANSSGVTVVAAHSMTRALFSTYNSKLFQVTRKSDSRTQDISVTSAGGRVDLAALNSFCPSGTTCGISILYDQTGNGNNLNQTLQNKMPTVALWTTKGGMSLPYCLTQASQNDGAIPGNGGQFLRNRLSTQKIPTGKQPTTEYMVVYTKYYQGHCCYDYGNMEAIKGESASLQGTGNDGPGTMFALYLGQTRDWTVGAGNGPWGMVDMEDGVYSGGESNGSGNNKDPSFAYPGTNVVAVLAKTNGTSSFVLRVGDGAFFEGFVVAGEESDTADTSIQSNLHSYFTR